VHAHEITLHLKEVNGTIPWKTELSYFDSEVHTEFDALGAFVLNRQYYVRAEVHDIHNNRISIMGNVHLEFEFSGTLFKLIEQRSHELLI
jgi:hypothetical protein